MNILICAATALEMPQDLITNHSVRYLITGVGMSQTAYRLGKCFAESYPELAIQIGLAGAYNPKFKIGDVVVVQEEIFADLGAHDADRNFVHLTKLLPLDISNPFEQYSIKPVLKSYGFTFPLVKGITVNSVRGYKEEIQETIAQYNPDVETMEGASFYAACGVENIPAIQLRSISNYVEPRNKDHWDIPLALKNLQEALKQILVSIP